MITTPRQCFNSQGDKNEGQELWSLLSLYTGETFDGLTSACGGAGKRNSSRRSSICDHLPRSLWRDFGHFLLTQTSQESYY